MQSRSFSIFYPVQRFYATPEKVYYLLWIIWGITAIAIAVFDQENSIISRFWAVSFGVLLATHVVLLLSKSNRYTVLKGRLTGEIVFYENRIAINGENINLNEIKRLNFVFNDYKGMPIEIDFTKERDLLYDVKAKLLQGVDNRVEIMPQSGSKIIIYFQREYPSEKYFMADILRSYYTAGKISNENTMTLMGFDSETDFEYFLSHPNFRVI